MSDEWREQFAPGVWTHPLESLRKSYETALKEIEMKTEQTNLEALNSATKYPSIPTYHALGDKGSLLDECINFPAGGEVVITEKIDGTNSRIIFMPDGRYIIGSRNDLLHAGGDLIHNPSQGIVDAVKPIAEAFTEATAVSSITVFYFETYGGKIGKAAKQYTTSQEVGIRLFDYCKIPTDILDKPVEEIAIWREEGGQKYATEQQLQDTAVGIALLSQGKTDLAPRIPDVRIMPLDIEETLEWLKKVVPTSSARLNHDAPGKPEGVVVRTPDRSVIAKIRYEDYERHLKRKK